MAVALGMSSTGCDSGGTPSLTSTSTSSGSGGDGSRGAFVDNGKDLWAGIEADMVASCGTCHEAGGIADTPFLALPDRYESMLAWPGIVVTNPDESLLLTYAITGAGHSGTNLDTAANDLQARVREWLEAEASAIGDPVDTTKPHLDPVTPIMGFNALYLNPLGTELEGMRSPAR